MIIATRHRITREFLLAGRATITVKPPEEFCQRNGIPSHYTFRLSIRDEANSPVFAQILTGPDNLHDFVYLGIVDRETGSVRVTAKSAFTKDSFPVTILNRVLIRLFAGEQDVIEDCGWQVMHEGQCGRCGRALTTPESVERGLGPECVKYSKG